MLKKLFFFAICLQSAFGEGKNPNLLLLSEIQPNTIINGVHVMTGQYVIDEVDYIVPGPEPIVIKRSFASSSEGIGFHIFSQYDAYFRKDHPQPFVCSDQDGYYFEFSKKSTIASNLEVAPGIHIGQMSGNTIRINGKDPNDNLFVLDNSGSFMNLTNLGHAYISGRTNFRNHHIRTKTNLDLTYYQNIVSGEQNVFYMTKGDGTKLYYRRSIKEPYHLSTHRSQGARDRPKTSYHLDTQNFKLDMEVFPNGNYRKYIYNTDRWIESLKAIETYNAKGELLNWVKVYYNPGTHQEGCPSSIPNKIETSDGKTLEYHLDGRLKNYSIPGKIPEKYEYADVPNPENRKQALRFIRSPQNLIKASVVFHEPVESKGWFGSEYIPNHFTGKVQHCYERGFGATFEYDFNKTIVFQGYKRTEFLYNEVTNRVYEIKHFHFYENEMKLQYTENYHWGENRNACNLISKTITIPDKGVVAARVFQFDFYGNVLEERIYGNISGEKNIQIQVNEKGIPTNQNLEYQSKKGSYTNKSVDILSHHNEDYNLPLTEQDARKTITHTYKKNTDLSYRIYFFMGPRRNQTKRILFL